MDKVVIFRPGIHLICKCGFCLHVHQRRGGFRPCPGLKGWGFRFSLRETLAYYNWMRVRI